MSKALLALNRPVSLFDLCGEPLSGIYKIRHIPSGRVYIGQSIDIDKRILTHAKALRDGCHTSTRMQIAFNEDGAKAFEVEVVELCEPDVTILRNRELYWMKQVGATNPQKGFNEPPTRVPEEVAAPRIMAVQAEIANALRPQPRLRAMDLTTCIHCHGAGRIGPNKRTCPVCLGKREVPRWIDQAIREEMFECETTKLPPDILEQIRKSEPPSDEYLPPPIYLKQR